MKINLNFNKDKLLEHIDKIIIGAAGVFAVVILFVFVLKAPTYEGQKPSEIEESINSSAQQLKMKLDGEPNDRIKYESNQKEFLAKMNNSIDGEVNDKIFFPLPGQKDNDVNKVEFTYSVPKIGPVAKPSLAVVKMAAFVPTEELSTTVTYDSAGKEIQDLDLVTVESSINAKALYSKFRESFAAKNFPPEKKKEQYAKPVFAKVQLQRKTQQSDGNWTEWTDVPQTKICYLKKSLEVPAAPSEFAIEMALVQFAKEEFRNEVLQPSVYCNAIPSDPWISPSFYNPRQIKLQKAEEERKRIEAEADKSRRLNDRSTPSRQTRDTRTPTRGTDDIGMMGVPGGGGGRGGREATPRTTSRRGENTRQNPATSRRQPATTERTTRPERQSLPATNVLQTITEEADFDKIKLKPEINISDLDKLVFWAHDDTTKPGEKYQYRIRVGLLNPIAGKNWFAENEKDYQNQVILWSDFADVNQVVEIPERLYFFATNYRETANDKIVEVMVARYMLGNWASKKYNVKSGEVIGKADEQPDARLANAGVSTDVIDFSTGAVMVDARKVANASKTGVSEYYELLYNINGNELQRTAIKERNWPAKTGQIYKEISSALDSDPVTLLTWDQAATQVNQRSPMSQPDSFEQGGRGGPGFPGEGGPMMPGMPGMP
ncbi:MAG: hypothetical protein ABFD79_16460 [Phycisphaerales bacterium]